jgi:predicted GIY-YIG superfamily endonuclease
MNRGYAIYIFINLDKNGCSYIGHSSNVVYRLKEHVHFRHIMRRSPINEVINKEDSNFELYIIGFNRSWALYAKI